MVEIARGRVPGYLDFFRLASLIYFICFVVLPWYLLHADFSSLRMSPFWLFHRPFTDDSFALAGAVAFIGYCSMLLGYLGGKSLARDLGGLRIALEPPLSTRAVATLGHALGMLGLVSLVVYTYSIGGVAPLILQALEFRSKHPPVVSRVSSLKMLSPLVMAGAFVFSALAHASPDSALRRRARLSVWAYGFVSLVVLFHQAGRYPFAAFLLTFPVARMVRTDRLRLRSALVTTLLVVAMLLFGRQLFEARFGTGAFASQSATLSTGGGAVARLVLVEFAFPVVTLSNAIVEVPSEVPFRWFYDFPLAIEYLVPQTLTGLTHPPTASMINSIRFGTADYSTVPVDLVSLGYFSAGVLGVVALLIVFGAVLGVFERVLPASADPLGAVLRAAWMFFMAMRVLYGDPQLVWGGGLHLIVLTALLLWLRGFLARPAIVPMAGA
jgi:hypothetical protein